MIDLDKLSDDAKAVAGGLFGYMHVGVGVLKFQMVESRPAPRTKVALDELVAAGILSVEPINDHGGVAYRPLVNCYPATEWVGGNRDKCRFPVTEPIDPKKPGTRDTTMDFRSGRK